ncbi:MAG: PIN domain-containing protein [Clostridiales bacterium]|jgi:predicted nucleic acid-binding protein|nr:PIN domain-containing protein [Clostridiales bacterium]
MIALIDTNVVLDYFLEREDFVKSASDCLEWLFVNKARVYLTAGTITDIYYLARRQVKSTSAAKEIIAKVLNTFRIVSVDGTDCIKALETEIDDYEDAVLAICAKKIKAESIITRNVKDFTASPIKAITPDEFQKLNG